MHKIITYCERYSIARVLPEISYISSRSSRVSLQSIIGRLCCRIFFNKKKKKNHLAHSLCFWFCTVYLLLFSDFYPGPTATHLPLSTFARQTGRDVRTGNGSLNLVGEIRRDEERPPESRHGDHDFTPWRHELRGEHVARAAPTRVFPD